ncbi:hypothetical protein QJQ45_005468 [Haematococcus lacustris]|nr:hypothetical protein QJQ45_005462 [Haematococcus lacustris]KAJ9506808.1 hypothetical protein QJQ45_005468 [Haematococcus lacustris]
MVVMSETALATERRLRICTHALATTNTGRRQRNEQKRLEYEESRGQFDYQPSPAQPSPAQPSPAQPSPAQPSPAQPSPAQPSPAQPSLAQPSPAQPSPAQPSPAQPSPAQPSPAQPSPAQPSPAQPSPAQPNPTQPYSPTLHFLLRSVPVNQMLKEALRQFPAGRVLMVDEFRTSRVSSAYSNPREALPGEPPESFSVLSAKAAQILTFKCMPVLLMRASPRPTAATDVAQ